MARRGANDAVKLEIQQHEAINDLSTCTLAFWVKPNTICDASPTLFEKDVRSVTWNPEGIVTCSHLGDDTTEIASTSSGAVPLAGGWKHVIIERAPGAGGPRIFVDAVDRTEPESRTESLLPLSDAAFAFRMFSSALVVGSYFDGDIAEVGIWNRLLTPAEKQALAIDRLTPKLIPTGLAGAWRLLGVASPEPADPGAFPAVVTGAAASDHVPDIVTGPPAKAATPSPAHEAEGVAQTAQLEWAAAAGADSYDVRFGTESPGAVQGNQAGTSFDPGPLAAGTLYYWRVDSKNAAGTTQGDVWSFRTKAANRGGPASPPPIVARGVPFVRPPWLRRGGRR